MKTSEFRQAIESLNGKGKGYWYCSDSVDYVSVLFRSNDSILIRLVMISTKMQNDYTFFVSGNQHVDITVRKEFIDLINDYASTPIDEREDDVKCNLSVKEMIQQEIYHNNDLLKEYFNPEIITKWRLGQPYQQMRLTEAVQEIAKDVDKIKDKKHHWFN